MMLAGRFLASLSMLLLGAHVLRSGGLLPVLGCLVLLALAWVPRPWAQRLIRVSLLLGAVEWLRTLFGLVAERQAIGAPWHRLAIILGLVAVLAILAAGLMSERRPVEAI